MKKTIKILSDKIKDLKETKPGALEGGFGSIKGGFNMNNVTTTNGFPGGCTNTRDCTKTTNTWGCSNSGTCFM